MLRASYSKRISNKVSLFYTANRTLSVTTHFLKETVYPENDFTKTNKKILNLNLNEQKKKTNINKNSKNLLEERFKTIIKQDDDLKNKLNSNSKNDLNSETDLKLDSKNNKKQKGSSSSSNERALHKKKLKTLLILGSLALGSTIYTTTREKIPPQAYIE